MKPKCKNCEKLRGELAEYQADYDHMLGILTRAYVSADSRGEPMVGRDRDWEKLAREFIKDRLKKRKKWIKKQKFTNVDDL